MITKKSATILIIIAIILSIIALCLLLLEFQSQLSGTKEIPTANLTTGNSTNEGNVGVDIIPSPVEDKLTNGEQS